MHTCQLANNHTDSCYQNRTHHQICRWVFVKKRKFSTKSVIARTFVCHQIIALRWQIDIFFLFLAHIWFHVDFSLFIFLSLPCNINWKILSVFVCVLCFLWHIWNVCHFNVFNKFERFAFFPVWCAIDAVTELASLIRSDIQFDCISCSCRIITHLKPSQINCW